MLLFFIVIIVSILAFVSMICERKRADRELEQQFERISKKVERMEELNKEQLKLIKQLEERL